MLARKTKNFGLIPGEVNKFCSVNKIESLNKPTVSKFK